MGQINCEIFRVFPVELSVVSTHFVIVCPYFRYSINQPVFLHKAKILRHFKGASIWVWDMNLGCKELGIWPSCVRNQSAQ